MKELAKYTISALHHVRQCRVFSSPHHESNRTSTRAIGSIHAFVFKPINADEQGSLLENRFQKLNRNDNMTSWN
jgi:hypothetical protein